VRSALYNSPVQGIAVLDAGGQYCHLLARRVREVGVLSHVLPIQTTAEELGAISGIIISGGPRSVTEPDSPRIDPSILSMGVPILGICYGHQLLAATMPGGVVMPSYSREYGLANLQLTGSSANGIFAGFPVYSRVWVSHGDSVETLPNGFEVLGSTEDCAVAAMANTELRVFGVQFHPEVTHTEHGQRLLSNFVTHVCRCGTHWKPSSAEAIEAIKADIRTRVGDRKNVLFFVSGGVDSTVAYKLCADALGQERVHGVYVDTGFMRQDESNDVMAAFLTAGFRNVRLRDASTQFLAAVGDEVEPEIKRKRIGMSFLTVEEDVLQQLPPGEWLLGQGTIYPDTIESGGTKESALIKTHHNRVPELVRRINAGEIVEPLAQFYKDEVREIGRALGLPARLIEKQPFPGPGLAVRFLCTRERATWSRHAKLDQIAAGYGMAGRILPVRGVGVQGDERTYAHVALLTGPYDETKIAEMAPVITNAVPDVNRVAFWIAAKGPLDDFQVEPMALSRAGLDLLRAADAVVRDVLARHDVEKKIWQCPVVMLPLMRRGESTIAIRPVESHDGMTAQYSRLSFDVLERIAGRLLQLTGIAAALYDVTNKPPATIEWE
jgi:GMP synthase (glutamine-hydrolysing)